MLAGVLSEYPHMMTRLALIRWKTVTVIGLLATSGLFATGCKLLAAPWLMWGEEPTKTVPAEYPYLSGKKVCILVWTDADTRFEYPQAQEEIAEHVRVALERSVPNISVVPTKSVLAEIRKDRNWDRSNPAELGKRFGAERTLALEITEYTTRDRQNPHHYRGRIVAYIKVYDTSLPDSAPAFRTEVTTEYPREADAGYGERESAVRRGALEAFAEDVSKKFFDHQVKK